MIRTRRWTRVFITGGAGLLGRHLQRDDGAAKWEIVAPGSRSLDVCRRERVIDEITDWRPHIVVHLAYRQDDRRVIVDGSRNVAIAAAKAKARLVHLSTDVVFPGRDTPYAERDAVVPMTDYGRWKAEAEELVMAECPTAAMIRTSLMYATSPLAPCQTMVERALRGSAVTFFTDEYRSFVHAADVASAVVTVATTPTIIGPLHVAGPVGLSRYDFAVAIARWLGANPALLRHSTLVESGITRPGRIVLDTSHAASLGIRCRSVADALD